MKALTLHQPHAFLIGEEAKIFETRSWPTKFRGLLAIHASRDCRKNCEGLIIDNGIIGDGKPVNPPRIVSPFDRYIKPDYNFIYGSLNNGGIEALVVVEDCQPAEIVYQRLQNQRDLYKPQSAQWHRVNDAMHFGDFSAGRWAWKLRLELTVNGNRCGIVRGYQRLWNLPLEVEEKLLAAYHEVTGGMICRLCGITTEHVKRGLRAWAEPNLCTACEVEHHLQ